MHNLEATETKYKMSQQWPHGAPDAFFPLGPPINMQTVVVLQPDGTCVQQTVQYQPGQGFPMVQGGPWQPNPQQHPGQHAGPPPPTGLGPGPRAPPFVPGAGFAPQPVPTLTPLSRPDVDVRGLAPRRLQKPDGRTAEVRLTRAAARMHHRRQNMMLLLTRVVDPAPPDGGNRNHDFLNKANWAKQEAEGDEPYYVETTNFPVVLPNDRIYLDRTSASFLQWSWAMAQDQQQLNTALGAIAMGQAPAPALPAIPTEPMAMHARGHLETKYPGERPENYPALADLADKYLDIRLRAVGSMKFSERAVWCQAERATAISILDNVPLPLREHRWETRQAIIGQMIHGGDLEADAILCNGGAGSRPSPLQLRHGQHFADYFKAAFPAFYFTLTVEAGVWLGKCPMVSSKENAPTGC
jgi:hypothetical protein